MSRAKQSGPVTTRAAARTLTNLQRTLPPAGEIPHARAYAGPPVPGRGLWAITVLSCPHCRAMHQHRAGEVARLLAGRLSKVCPTTGRPYQLAPVSRRREAVRRAA